MKKNFTDITVILDKSGSMSSIAKDTIGGFNTFIEEQKKLPGEVRVTLVQFDGSYTISYAGLDINHVKPLDETSYRPSGNTALIDAVGSIIDKNGQRFAAMKPANRPEKVIVLIVTDGEENASKEYRTQDVINKIAHQQEVYKWAFVFSGADQNAWATAEKYKMSTANSTTFDKSSIGTQNLWKKLSDGTQEYRTSCSVDNMDFYTTKGK